MDFQRILLLRLTPNKCIAAVVQTFLKHQSLRSLIFTLQKNAETCFKNVCNVIDSPKTMLQMLKDLPDVYTRVSSFLAWINATILSNGGLASCNFSLTAEPSQGRI